MASLEETAGVTVGMLTPVAIEGGAEISLKLYSSSSRNPHRVQRIRMHFVIMITAKFVASRSLRGRSDNLASRGGCSREGGLPAAAARGNHGADRSACKRGVADLLARDVVPACRAQAIGQQIIKNLKFIW